MEICAKNTIKWILPLTDLEVDVFNQCCKFFVEMGITVCISNESAISICRDKYKTVEFIKNHGNVVKAIPTWRYKDIKRQNINLPVICKLYNGRSSQGLKKIRNIFEWEEFTASENVEDYIIQPYIEGSVVTVDVVQDVFGQCIAVPRKELLRTLNGAGTSVYVFHDEKLEQDSITLASLLGVLGCVIIEFILDGNGDYHFLECNPRFSGGVVFSCMAGYDCVKNHMRAFRKEEIDSQWNLVHNLYIARRYESHIMAE